MIMIVAGDGKNVFFNPAHLWVMPSLSRDGWYSVYADSDLFEIVQKPTEGEAMKVLKRIVDYIDEHTMYGAKSVTVCVNDYGEDED